jgi:hypothetical protein
LTTAVSTLTFSIYFPTITVINSGSAAAWVSTLNATPTAGGADCTIVQAGASVNISNRGLRGDIISGLNGTTVYAIGAAATTITLGSI